MILRCHPAWRFAPSHAHYHVPSFGNGATLRRTYSGFSLSDCPWKSIQQPPFHRDPTTHSSLTKGFCRLLTLPQQFRLLYASKRHLSSRQTPNRPLQKRSCKETHIYSQLMQRILAPSKRGLAKPKVLTGGVSYRTVRHSLRLCLKAKPPPSKREARLLMHFLNKY